MLFRSIVYLSTPSLYDFGYLQHFKELEYIVFDGRDEIDIDVFLPFHSLKEVRIPRVELRSDTSLSTNFPFFHTLKVLHVLHIDLPILAGQTFHKLERYEDDSRSFEINTWQLAELPVCTRLVVGLFTLASMKLPQILELSVLVYHDETDFDEPDPEEPNSVWERHVAVNSNLSGLKLLHFSDPRFEEIPYTDLIQILRSVPALETLIIDERYIENRYMDFFEAFVPVRARETTGLYRSSGEGQMSGVLCPKLESLQIQEFIFTERPRLLTEQPELLTEQSELIPILQDIVTLRTTIGSPLKSFTYYVSRYVSRHEEQPYSEQKWELIGKDGRFTMDEVVPAQRFELDI